MITPSAVLQRSMGEPGFVTRSIAGETIVIPVSSRVGDLDAIYTFNEVGSRIWSLLESPTSVDSIVDVLSQEYEAVREHIRRDVVELLDELQEKGLIRLAEPSTA